MPKTNTRAIGKLLEAHKVLKKLGRSSKTGAGQAFALELVKLLEKGKPMTATVGTMTFNFRPDDVRVSKTKVLLGKVEVRLCALTGGHDGEFEMAGANDEPLVVRIAQAEMAPA